jgi:DHA1 family bicyclomycin/chloramphenicol resistance-like MFS transporter
LHQPDANPDAARKRDDSVPRGMLLLLIAVTAVAPLSLNILMPALPGLVKSFATDIVTVQLALSLYLVVMAIAQLMHGALSDRFGRRPVLIAGFALTALASLAAAAATTIGTLIAARSLQAVGAATGIVVGRAIIRDLYQREQSASMIGWVTMAIMVVPLIVPWLGGVLDTRFGWPAIFLFIALISTGVLVWIALALPETLRATALGSSPVHYLAELRALFASREFIGYVLCSATGSALFFATLGGAPHVVVTQMERSPVELGLWLATGAVGYMGGNYVSARWSPRVGIDRMIIWGAWLVLAGALGTVALVWAVPHWGPATIFVPQLFTAFGNGLVMPNAIAGAISVRPQTAGTASGITGFSQMAMGGAAAQFVGHILAPAPTAMPMALVLIGFAVSCVLSYLVLVRKW